MSRSAVPVRPRVALVDKPVGPTSFEAVRAVRRIAGTRRVGHGGTLDPFASGLLVIGIGPATRLLPYVLHGAKTYRARIRFGIETDSGDPTGEIVREADVPDDVEALREGLHRFEGTIEQVPPRHSAVKIDGRRAYELARAGEDFEPRPRTVRVDSFVLETFEPPFADVVVRCGGGTYIRSLARDLGRALGSAAHLTGLRRTAIGSVSVDDAVPLDGIEAAHAQGRLLRPPRVLVAGWPTLELDAERARRVRHGGQPESAWWSAEFDRAPDRLALVDTAGELLAVAEAATGDSLRLATVLGTEAGA